jgi:hypothetical protein
MIAVEAPGWRGATKTNDALDAAYRFQRNKSALVYTHFFLDLRWCPRAMREGCEF